MSLIVQKVQKPTASNQLNTNNKLINNINLWTITDGSQGMISQVNGLAQYLTPSFIEKKIKLKWHWNNIQAATQYPYKNYRYIYNYYIICLARIKHNLVRYHIIIFASIIRLSD